MGPGPASETWQGAQLVPEGSRDTESGEEASVFPAGSGGQTTGVGGFCMLSCRPGDLQSSTECISAQRR